MSNEAAPAVEPPPPDVSNQVVTARLVAGFIQGLVLYALYRSTDTHGWPASNPYWMAVLLMVFVFVPVLFVQAVGIMRTRTLAIWMAASTLILAGLAWHDIARQWDPAKFSDSGDGSMTFALVFFAAAGLFIAQSIIAAADTDKRYIARYPAYFEAAWKLGVQLALAVAFVGVFWGVLWLGAVLFNLINLDFLETLIEKSWFAIPATSLAAAAAVHVTDVRSKLVAGIRTVALTLLSWLLPLMTLIAVGFTASLPFTGLAPLWATRSACQILLIAAATLVILINAAFQDGDPAHSRPAVLRYAELAAACVLVPIVLIATYALWLRVAQYGWTVERIITAACILVALCYAFGYAAAAAVSLLRNGWMDWMQTVNIATAFLVLAILLALFSPLADPSRLAVNSQVARLTSGRVKPEAFDFGYLQREGDRYGHAALTALSTGEFGARTDAIRRLAKAAMQGASNVVVKPTASDIALDITVYPNSRALPHSLIVQDWSKTPGAPSCLTTPENRCDAFFADLDGDGSEEIVLTTGSDSTFWGTVLKQDANKQWQPVASLNGQCSGMLAALKRGAATVAPPPSGWRDWVILGVPLHVMPLSNAQAPCPG